MTTTLRHAHYAHWLALSAVVLAGCGLARSAPGAAPGAAPGDASHVVAMVGAANSAEILYADLALATSGQRDVIAFATMARTDHESMNAAVVALVTRLKMTPMDNATSFNLRDDAEAKRLALRELEGFAFDSAYSASAIASHRALLGTIDLTLVPSGGNRELRALLLQVRAAIAAHLEHAVGLLAKVLAGRP